MGGVLRCVRQPLRVASHRRIKPDAEAFEHVLDSPGCRPAQVLFLDDNLLNVEAAQGLGMDAFCVRGAGEAERVPTDLGIIEKRA
jgi:putative hydrolase of the HAD superfamily